MFELCNMNYMVNDLSNSLDYPRQRNTGFLLDYVFDIDFVDLKIVIPSVRDFNESGGVIGARSSLFVSHNFPLTLGVGFITDLNQSSFLSHYLEIEMLFSVLRKLVGRKYQK